MYKKCRKMAYIIFTLNWHILSKNFKIWKNGLIQTFWTCWFNFICGVKSTNIIPSTNYCLTTPSAIIGNLQNINILYLWNHSSNTIAVGGPLVGPSLVHLIIEFQKLWDMSVCLFARSAIFKVAMRCYEFGILHVQKLNFWFFNLVTSKVIANVA